MTKLGFRFSPRTVLIVLGVVIAAVAAAWYWHDDADQPRLVVIVGELSGERRQQ